MKATTDSGCVLCNEMPTRELARDGRSASERLNRECFCLTLDAKALRAA
jgi:hypothetical protein